MDARMMLSEQIKLVLCKTRQTSADTVINGDGIDLSADGGWEGVLFIGYTDTAAAGNILKAQASDDNGSADAYADLDTAVVAPGASDERQLLDVVQPNKKWIRPVITRGTATITGELWAVLYRGRRLPFDNALAGTTAVKQSVQPVA